MITFCSSGMYLSNIICLIYYWKWIVAKNQVDQTKSEPQLQIAQQQQERKKAESEKSQVEPKREGHKQIFNPSAKLNLSESKNIKTPGSISSCLSWFQDMQG